jgi:hypothetical protein
MKFTTVVLVGSSNARALFQAMYLLLHLSGDAVLGQVHLGGANPEGSGATCPVASSFTTAR